MSRSPIQVPDEIKEKIESLKETFHCKTNYDVIDKLIRSYESLNDYRQEVQQKMNAVYETQRKEMIKVGEDVKKDFDRLKREYFIQEDSGLLAFLICHHDTSENFTKEAMKLLRHVK